jgi:hypothetical protein
MDSALILYLVILALATVCILSFYAARAYIKFRGEGVVTCPETGKPAAVEVDKTHAALTFTRGIPDLRLKRCSRWPERQECGQECLVQIELTPEQCMVRQLLTNWYVSKACVFCGKVFGKINWTDHKPALMNAEESKTVEWPEVPTEMLPQVLSTHLPVCWNCHVAETFRREHLDLVVERSGRSSVAHV